MKHIFVIDENVAIFAATLEGPDGSRDLTSARLLTLMVANCHGFAWSTAINARWSSAAQRLQAARRMLAASFPAVMSQAHTVADKCPCPENGDPPALDGEATWSTKLVDDRDFIRLAAYFGVCFLVTYDAPLRADILALGLDARYGFRVVTPLEAIPFASELSI
jgi:hypothetical protein